MIILASKNINDLIVPGIWIYREEEDWWCVEDRSDVGNPVLIADVYLDLDFAVKIARLYNDLHR